MTGPYSVRPWWSRREFLKSSVAVAAGAYGLSPSFAMAAPVPEKFDGSGFKLKAPEPNAKSGGVLRHGMPLRAPHFDIHQAGTIFILGATACMFDNLIRRDPNNGAKTIIPDLAHSWEIAPKCPVYCSRLLRGRGRQERFDCSQQITHIYWFRDIGIASAAQSVHFIGGRYEGGHGNDWDVLCLVILLQ